MADAKHVKAMRDAGWPREVAEAAAGTNTWTRAGNVPAYGSQESLGVALQLSGAGVPVDFEHLMVAGGTDPKVAANIWNNSGDGTVEAMKMALSPYQEDRAEVAQKYGAAPRAPKSTPRPRADVTKQEAQLRDQLRDAFLDEWGSGSEAKHYADALFGDSYDPSLDPGLPFQVGLGDTLDVSDYLGVVAPEMDAQTVQDFERAVAGGADFGELFDTYQNGPDYGGPTLEEQLGASDRLDRMTSRGAQAGRGTARAAEPADISQERMDRHNELWLDDYRNQLLGATSAHGMATTNAANRAAEAITTGSAGYQGLNASAADIRRLADNLESGVGYDGMVSTAGAIDQAARNFTSGQGYTGLARSAGNVEGLASNLTNTAGYRGMNTAADSALYATQNLLNQQGYQGMSRSAGNMESSARALATGPGRTGILDGANYMSNAARNLSSGQAYRGMASGAASMRDAAASLRYGDAYRGLDGSAEHMLREATNLKAGDAYQGLRRGAYDLEADADALRSGAGYTGLERAADDMAAQTAELRTGAGYTGLLHGAQEFGDIYDQGGLTDVTRAALEASRRDADTWMRQANEARAMDWEERGIQSSAGEALAMMQAGGAAQDRRSMLDLETNAIAQQQAFDALSRSSDLYGQVYDADLGAINALQQTAGAYGQLYNADLGAFDARARATDAFGNLYQADMGQIDALGRANAAYNNLYGADLAQIDAMNTATNAYGNLYNADLAQINAMNTATQAYNQLHNADYQSIQAMGMANQAYQGMHNAELNQINAYGQVGNQYNQLYGADLAQIDAMAQAGSMYNQLAGLDLQQINALSQANSAYGQIHGVKNDQINAYNQAAGLYGQIQGIDARAAGTILDAELASANNQYDTINQIANQDRDLWMSTLGGEYAMQDAAIAQASGLGSSALGSAGSYYGAGGSGIRYGAPTQGGGASTYATPTPGVPGVAPTPYAPTQQVPQSVGQGVAAGAAGAARRAPATPSRSTS